MTDANKQNIIFVRDAVFKAGDGKSLDEVMQGTTMAQGKLIASIARDPDASRKIVDHYYQILRDAMDAYCSEFAN